MILTRAVASRELVARRCRIAAHANIAEGMDLAHARSLLPPGITTHTEPHRPDADERSLRALARWALRIAPRVAIDPPDALLIDITGTQRLYRSEPRVIRSVAAGLRRKGLAVRIAAASTFGCAWGVCHFARHALARVPPGDEPAALKGLPVAALRIDAATLAGLAELGITCVEDLLRLPRPSLRSRFDPLLVQRLLQALGELDEPIEPISPPPVPRVELNFDGPTDHWESIETAVRHSVERLAAQLAPMHRGARRLDLELRRPHAEPRCVSIDLSRPSGATKHLWGLLGARLERLGVDGGVEGVVLTATRTARLRHEQLESANLGASADVQADVAWGELIDALVVRLGADRVVQIQPVESHLPERAFRVRSVMDPASSGKHAAFVTAPRPTRLLSKPERAKVMALTPDGPILSVTWRGEHSRILTCSGPERISAEWWRWGPTGASTAPPDRDYYAVQNENGRNLWICRHVGTGNWFVHGEWI